MIYYGAQRVCILPGCLNFNFLILFSCAVPPEFYGILLHSTYVYIYDFTKEYKKWKQLKNSSRNDQSVILMQVLYSQLHTPLRVLKKKLQATYTRLKHSRILTLSSRCCVPVLGRKERKCDKTTLWFRLRQKHINIYETEELLKEGCRRHYNAKNFPFYHSHSLLDLHSLPSPKILI